MKMRTTLLSAITIGESGGGRCEIVGETWEYLMVEWDSRERDKVLEVSVGGRGKLLYQAIYDR